MQTHNRRLVLSLLFFAVMLSIVFLIFGTAHAATPSGEPKQVVPVLKWVDYTRTTTPIQVTPLVDLITETLTAKVVEPMGPHRLWFAFPQDTSKQGMQDIASEFAAIAHDHPEWEGASYRYDDTQIEMVCPRSDAAEFISCMQNTLPPASRNEKPNMGLALDLLWNEIHPGQVVPSPDTYDGIDIVLLRGSFRSQDIDRSTTIKTCFLAPEDLGVRVKADRLFCSAMWMQSSNRVGLITMCDNALECDERRMALLTGYRRIIRTTKPAEASKALENAIYSQSLPQQSWAVAHILSETVVSDTLPAGCELQGDLVSCHLGFLTEFTLSFQAKPRPMNFGMWSPPPPWAITTMWQISEAAPAPACPGDTVAYAMSYVAFLSKIQQVFIPFAQQYIVCDTGCNIAYDNINDYTCPQRPVGDEHH